MSADRLHQAYLVRLWAVHYNGDLRWQATIKDVHTGECHAFADLPSLCRFLMGVKAIIAPPLIDERTHREHKDPSL